MGARDAQPADVDGLAVICHEGWHDAHAALMPALILVRGAGVAKELIDDAERPLRGDGVTVAWSPCAIGNDRAARFYEKNGWALARVVTYESETANGPFRADVWRYEKGL